MFINVILDRHNGYSMKKAIFPSVLIFSFAFQAQAESSKKEYVENWKNTAIQQMNKYGVPASITLSQGILESAIGTSDLAVKANNHFGIKCSNWTGEKMYKDDDKKNECFRVYNNAAESYEDHSLFLKKPRYAGLFELKTTDYKGWAKGLRKAGYATNPQYADRLIRIIEELGLDQYDSDNLLPESPTKAEIKKENTNGSFQHSSKSVEINMGHKVHVRNSKSKYIIAQKGDTYYRIASEFNLTLWELRLYNDFDKKKDVLKEGDIVYIQPKRMKAENKQTYLTRSNQETLRSISQETGVKLKVLKRHNPSFTDSEPLQKGTTIKL